VRGHKNTKNPHYLENALNLMQHRRLDIHNDAITRVISKRCNYTRHIKKNDAITARHISALSQKYKNVALFRNALILMQHPWRDIKKLCTPPRHIKKGCNYTASY
jgi:hypothetical protein